jgi:hexosaminidase
MVGWEEIGRAKLLPSSISQRWNTGESNEIVQHAVQQGAKVIFSPADKAYLDMKYDPRTPLGLAWAGYVNVMHGYSWDPATEVEGVTEADIVGVEAPLWSETIVTLNDIEYMTFPRLLGYAEMGWSQQSARDWNTYKTRLAAHGPRLSALGINFYQAPEISWQ